MAFKPEDLTIDNCHNTLWKRIDDNVLCIRKSGRVVKTVLVHNYSDDDLFHVWEANSIDAIKRNLINNHYNYIGEYKDLDWESYFEEVKANGIQDN